MIDHSEYFNHRRHDLDMKEIVPDRTNPLTILGKFDGTWFGELEDALKTSNSICYRDRPIHKDYLYEVYDLSVCPTIQKMPKALGFVEGYYKVQIQSQKPGCIMSRHVDPPEGYKMVPEELQHKGIRVLVMLTPWEYGQIMGFNNEIWREWEAGTIIHCDFLNVIHFTANCSSTSRPILSIQGLASDRLIEMINSKQKNIINI
jgi:hypothetical protein